MISIFKGLENKFITSATIEKNCWVNVFNPERDELDRLAEELSIPPDFLTDPLDIDERARIEIEGKTILIVLRVPKADQHNSEVPYSTLPVGIILANNVIVTVCSSDINIILELFNGKSKSFSFENKSRFILNVFYKTALLYLNYLKDINKRTNEVEKELQKSMKNEELIKLLNIEKSLVFFTTSLKSNELMMERFQRIQTLKLNVDEIDLLDDVIIDNKQAIEMANIYSNILSGMMDAFASVISNNLNIVMKFLTSVTILLMIPTLIASIYGMNVDLPFQHVSHAFFVVMGICLILSIISVLIFLKNKWF
ncbi:Mg2 transporter protein CorA family protein [uncultured Desulfobacterium sp.]|uniref:Mg2 transporter protein CorA family protein n=1 Tax=uncultured Desulfobacterium sp. TaxID=201089 RepID=A0A445MX15_9BACT|nr:Mg2 transporter protein CorA family protein [uncultured Desulfobacterium sp.]